MTYRFESANKGTVEISVSGAYTNGTYDVDVSYALDTPAGHEGNDTTFEEIDAGSADDLIQWLVDEGVEFESMRSCAFNRAYIASVMLDGDTTEQELLDEAANWTEADIARMLDFIEFTTQKPDLLSVQQAAEELGVTRARVNQLVTSKVLDAVKIGERYAVSRKSVERRKADEPKGGRPKK